MIDVLVLNYNDYVTTSQFVNRLKDYSCVSHILIVDNHSTDDSFEKLSELNSSKIIVVDSGRNCGYGAGNNFGIRYLYENFHSNFILLSNPDVVVLEEVLVRLENFLQENDVYSIVSPFMCDANGIRQSNTAFRIPTKWEYILSIDLFFRKFIHSFNYNRNEYDSEKKIKTVGAVSGSMFLMRTSDMLKYGMFDESIFLYCEEVVLAKKLAENGKKQALLLDFTYIHNHSVSISKTYRSLFSKQHLLNKSKLFVLNRYFGIKKYEYVFAYILTRLIFIELFFVAMYRKICKHK